MSWHLKHIRTITAMYVSSVDILSIHYAWWAVTQRTSKTHKTVKIGGWVLAPVLAWGNTVIILVIISMYRPLLVVILHADEKRNESSDKYMLVERGS